jgi:hypothetical protein
VLDWTFNADYLCSVTSGAEGGPAMSDSICSAQQLSSAAGVGAGTDPWKAVPEGSSSGIDRALLAMREDILFYDEMLLYQVI